MENYFYVDKNQKQAGPITPDRFAEEGITAETLVWCKNLPQWTPAGEIEELIPFLGADENEHTIQSATTTQSSGVEIPAETTHDTTQGSHKSAPPQEVRPMPATEEKEVPNYLWLAVLSVLFMLSPIGIVAIHHAAKVDFNVLRGDIDKALRHSNLAVRWSLIAIAVSVVLLIFLLATFGPNMIAYLSENYEFIF